MPAILVLGLAAALYPQLLAVVVVILTRPRPRRLLWACYAGSVFTSVACGVAILLVFRDRGSVAGSSSHRLGASVFLIVGVIGILVAILVATERGRRLFGSGVARLPLRSRNRPGGSGSVDQQKSRTHRALERGSVPVGVLAGAILGIPGPFDVLALGRLTRGGYQVIASIVLIIAFNLLKFLLIEIPIVSFAIDPDGQRPESTGFRAG